MKRAIIILVLALALATGAFIASIQLRPVDLSDPRDPRCDGPARYDAMRDGADCS